ncbi:FIG006285: ICC-like protein phosphoesterase [Olavius algarvensis Delta 1 endosymbiont]|nr:FIG006285: ICC-like protein phosphoesterase [Olavius algarvensis Delta 1 endosymbiont]
MSHHKAYSMLGQKFLLSSDRALYWDEQRLLIVADPHFGKAQTFREKGLAVPRGTTADDLKRLSALIKQFRPERLLILGDLVHDRIEHPAEINRMIDRWRGHHRDVQLILVRGNHDLGAGDPPAKFKIDQVADELLIDPFIFTHQPEVDSSCYGIAGHLHPAVSLTGKGRSRETLPCFCFGPRIALLPAFGGFTGNQVIRPTIRDRIYVIAGNEVIKVPIAQPLSS